MEYSMLISKPLLSESGAVQGYVRGLLLSEDLSSLLFLACADAEEEEFYLPATAIKRIGDAIVVKAVKNQFPSGVPCPVGKAVYDEDGAFLGAASALTDGPCGVLTVVGAFGEKQYPAKKISAGECVIVRGSRPQKVKKAPSKPRPVPKDDRAPAPLPSLQDDQPQNTVKYRTDLLGKQAQREIGGLLSAGERVTAETLRRAHENNRLLELASAVLTEA